MWEITRDTSIGFVAALDGCTLTPVGVGCACRVFVTEQAAGEFVAQMGGV